MILTKKEKRMFLKLLAKLLTTEAAKHLIVYTANEIAKRTDNKVDDMAVRSIAKTLDVPLTILEETA